MNPAGGVLACKPLKVNQLGLPRANKQMSCQQDFNNFDEKICPENTETFGPLAGVSVGSLVVVEPLARSTRVCGFFYSFRFILSFIRLCDYMAL